MEIFYRLSLDMGGLRINALRARQKIHLCLDVNDPKTIPEEFSFTVLFPEYICENYLSQTFVVFSVQNMCRLVHHFLFG